MNTPETQSGSMWEILSHQEVPGYRKAFHIIVAVAVIYFIHIFVYTFFTTL
jgi:hypothetical protein